MSDLLSPILFVMRDESESFWCFVFLMERLGPNFNRDQSGMHSQLFALSKVFSLSVGGRAGACACVYVWRHVYVGVGLWALRVRVPWKF